MRNVIKFFIFFAIISVILAIYYIKTDTIKEIPIKTVDVREIETKFENFDKNTNVTNNKKAVTLYFLKTEINTIKFKKVKRPIDYNSDILKASIIELLKGPTQLDQKNGYYSEIPKGTKLLSLKEDDESIIIDLNSEFQFGGGTDSIVNRIKQLIKTVSNVKTDKKIYLYLDGKQADVIGGEGIIINQPLDENSIF